VTPCFALGSVPITADFWQDTFADIPLVPSTVSPILNYIFPTSDQEQVVHSILAGDQAVTAATG